MIKRIGVSAGLIAGWFAFLGITPAYGLTWSFQDSYKISNNDLSAASFNGGVEGFLTGNDLSNLVYAGLQTHASNNNTQAGIGVGYRRLIGANHTVGTYLFWDGLFDYADQDIAFSNFTLGIEGNFYFLNFRLNGYAPFSRITRDQHNWITQNQGHDIIQKGNSYLGEMIQHGWDGQIGISAFKDKVRLFGGTYYFDGDMAKPIHGVVGGASMDITPRIRVNGQYIHDSLNKPMVTVGVQLNRAASPALQTTPLYRLWRPAERALLPAGSQVKGRWYVKETDVYFVSASKARENNGQKNVSEEWATFETPTPFIDQTFLDNVAHHSPKKANIVIEHSVYDVKGSLRLHPGQSLQGIQVNPLTIPRLFLEKPLCLSDNTSVRNMAISISKKSMSCNMVTMSDIKNAVFVDNQLNIEKCFSDEVFVGIDVNNITGIVNDNILHFVNTAYCSQATLKGIRIEGNASFVMPINNRIILKTHSMGDQLQPISIEKLPCNLQRPSVILKNTIELHVPYAVEKYLDDFFIEVNGFSSNNDEAVGFNENPKDKFEKKIKPSFLSKASLSEAEYNTCKVIKLRRDDVSKVKSSLLKSRFTSPLVKQAEIRDLNSIHDRLDAKACEIQSELKKLHEVEDAYEWFYNSFLKYDVTEKEITLEMFTQKPEKEISALFDQYITTREQSSKEFDQKPAREKEKIRARHSLSGRTFSSYTILSNYFEQKKILNDIEAKQKQILDIINKLQSQEKVKPTTDR